MSYTPSDYSECPGFLRDYIYYLLTIKGRSKLTVEGYFIDLRTYLRFLKHYKGLVSKETPFCTSAEAVLCLKKWIPKNLSSLVMLALFIILLTIV